MVRSILGNIRVAIVCSALGLLSVGNALANGALAIDTNQGPAFGVGRDYRTMAEAEQRALSECGRGCRVVVRFVSGCAAYSADQTRGSTVFGFARARSKAAAQAKADGYCRSYGGKRCQIRVWGCNRQ